MLLQASSWAIRLSPFLTDDIQEDFSYFWRTGCGVSPGTYLEAAHSGWKYGNK
jgi:hypothetical protein